MSDFSYYDQRYGVEVGGPEILRGLFGFSLPANWTPRGAIRGGGITVYWRDYESNNSIGKHRQVRGDKPSLLEYLMDAPDGELPEVREPSDRCSDIDFGIGE